MMKGPPGRNTSTATAPITPGSGRALPRYRPWQLLSRSLFHLHIPGDDGARETWSVDVRHDGDPDGEVRARLYRDGVHHASSPLPAAFPVPGGTIEVEISSFGLKRCHYVTDDGHERQLEPDHASAEGQRARLERTAPALSRAIGIASVSILVVALVLGVPQLLEEIMAIPLVAQHLGSFSSPFRLEPWANTSLVVASIAASVERALRLRYNRILDGGIIDGDE